ncbi:hypothetical protein GCK32_008282 [Trichostrongylus colubriformis]|uniref:Uncharacterized protein n=1 Tax=Trichostrongylus colubriformis TaxID=6319 RepID=A0AAN8IUE9_TRICO
MVCVHILVAALLSTVLSKKKVVKQPHYTTHVPAGIKERAPFVPRALLYLSYKFPLRDDGSLIAFMEYETRRGRGVVGEEDLAKVMFPNQAYETVKEKLTHMPNAMDTPFWRDVPLHSMVKADTDLDGATAAWMSEPAFTKTEYIGEDSMKHQHYSGISIKQIHEPFGLPFEVPCYSKHMDQLNSTTIFYKIPNRKFLSLNVSSTLEHNPKFQLSSYLSHVVKNMATTGSKPEVRTAWPQLIGRNVGAFTHTETKHFLNVPDGRLTISPNPEALTSSHEEETMPWGSLICTAMIDNEPRHLGVVVNLDYVANGRHPLKYSEIKVLDEEDQKPAGKKEPLPVLDTRTNLKIDISWDDWSCCSACCCTSMLCGKFYTPDRKCSQLRSVKVRKGYLSLMKIKPEKPVRPWDGHGVSMEFQMLMSISPYKEKGIPLFSTMWDNRDLRTIKAYKERLYRERFKAFPNITKHEVGQHPGIYIDEMECTEEKYDCAKLAHCRGINIKSKIDQELEEEADPCAEYESEIEIIFIEREHTDVALFTGKNYRLRLREEVFSTDATRASWRVSSRPPAHYDKSKSCLEQGIVLLKNGDLLMTSLTSRDVRRHVEVTLSDGRKLSVQFSNAGLRLGLGEDSGVLIMWAVILTVFFILLILFVMTVHNRRRARTQQILLSKMRKRLRAEGKVQ